MQRTVWPLCRPRRLISSNESRVGCPTPDYSPRSLDQSRALTVGPAAADQSGAPTFGSKAQPGENSPLPCNWHHLLLLAAASLFFRSGLGSTPPSIFPSRSFILHHLSQPVILCVDTTSTFLSACFISSIRQAVYWSRDFFSAPFHGLSRLSRTCSRATHQRHKHCAAHRGTTSILAARPLLASLSRAID